MTKSSLKAIKMVQKQTRIQTGMGNSLLPGLIASFELPATPKKRPWHQTNIIDWTAENIIYNAQVGVTIPVILLSGVLALAA